MKKALLAIPLLMAVALGAAGWSYLKPFNREIPAPLSGGEIGPLPDGVVSSAPKDGIPSIDNPKFESVETADTYLHDDLAGIGIVDGDVRRFYPFQIIAWHELVNDDINGTPVLVSYCPLSGTAVAFDRRVDGTTHEFGVSGKLYNSNLVMYDRESDSFWSQADGKAIGGELTGKILERYPRFEHATWKDWKSRYPDSEVLSRDTGHLRDYAAAPYAEYEASPSVWYPIQHTDDRLAAKTWISGITVGGTAKAYPVDAVQRENPINDIIGNAAILVVKDSQDGIKIFDRDLPTDRGFMNLTFAASGRDRFRDEQTGSVWDDNGYALEGDLKGRQLEHIPSVPSFWFSWAAFYPGTLLFE